MTRKERLHRCYFHQETDRPGVYIRPGFPKDDPSYDKLKNYVAEHTELKAGWQVIESTYDFELRTEDYSEDFERQIAVLKTPKGDLTRSVLVSLKGQPGLHETFLCKKREDAEKYLTMPSKDFTIDISTYSEKLKEIGDTGIVQVNLGSNPAANTVKLFGSEVFAMMSISDRDILHILCEREMEFTIRKIKEISKHKIGPYFSMLGQEYLVPPLHGPKDFYDFNVKYDKPIIDLVHEIGGKIHIHSHGSIKNVFQGFIDMGTDVLHPFEAPPEGDILPEEAKEMARDKITLEGNIQISHMYESTPDKLRNETEALMKTVFDDNKGLIVCPTASPYIRGEGENCFENFKTMIDTVLNFN